MVLWLFVRFEWGFWRATGVRWGFVHALGSACLRGFLMLVEINEKYCRNLSTNSGLVAFSLHRPPLPLLTTESMKTSQDKPRQAKRFLTPRQITQPADQFGCVGFISYGFIQYCSGEVVHVRNPDFNWTLVVH